MPAPPRTPGGAPPPRARPPRPWAHVCVCKQHSWLSAKTHAPKGMFGGQVVRLYPVCARLVPGHMCRGNTCGLAVLHMHQTTCSAARRCTFASCASPSLLSQVCVSNRLGLALRHMHPIDMFGGQAVRLDLLCVKASPPNQVSYDRP